MVPSSADPVPRQPLFTVCRITPAAKAEPGIQLEIWRRARSSAMAAIPTTPAIQACAVTDCSLFQNACCEPAWPVLPLRLRPDTVPPGTAAALENRPAARTLPEL